MAIADHGGKTGHSINNATAIMNPYRKATDHSSYNIQKKIPGGLRCKCGRQNFKPLKWYVGRYLYYIRSREGFLKLSTKTINHERKYG